MYQVKNPQTNRLIYVGGTVYKRLAKNIGTNKINKLKRYTASKKHQKEKICPLQTQFIHLIY